MPDLTTISGTVYTGAGAVMLAGVKVLTVYEVWKDGQLISDDSFDVRTVTDGVISFTVPRGSTIRVQGEIIGLTKKKYLSVPNIATATLESLLPAVSPPSSAVSQAAFNTLYDLFTNLTGVLVFIALANFALAGNSGLAGAVL